MSNAFVQETGCEYFSVEGAGPTGEWKILGDIRVNKFGTCVIYKLINRVTNNKKTNAILNDGLCQHN